jgi:hypothetical protein
MTRVKNPQAEAGESQGGGAAVAEAQAPKRVLPTSLPGRETHTDDVREPALSDIKMPALGEGLPERGDEQVAIADARVVANNEYLAELAFMEEPVMIRIEPSQEDNAAMTVDCACNGKGAEVLDARTGKWLELNVLPVGLVVTTKRKYVEILARSKTMRVQHARPRRWQEHRQQRPHAPARPHARVLGDQGHRPRHAWLTASCDPERGVLIP